MTFQDIITVSYTHLDVYKRQAFPLCFTATLQEFYSLMVAAEYQER